MYLTKSQTDRLQWICLISTFFHRYIEFAVIFVVSLFFYKRIIPFNKKILSFSLLVYAYSFISVLYWDYDIQTFNARCLPTILIIWGYSILFHYWNTNVRELWRKYCNICFVISILGLLQTIISFVFKTDVFSIFNNYDHLQFGSWQPPTATLAEMADFSCTISPYVFYHILKVNKLRALGWRFFFVLGVASLSFSNLFYAGVLICLFIKVLNNSKRLFAIIIAAILLNLSAISLLMEENEQSQRSAGEGRTIGTLLWKSNESFTGLSFIDNWDMITTYNASTFATYSNLYVAIHAPNRITGTGLCTHQNNYQKVLRTHFINTEEHRMGLNQDDAYSLFTRLYSELGLVGIFFFIFFIVIKNLNLKNPINASILIVICMHLLGNGNYFLNGFIFLLYMYIYTNVRLQKSAMSYIHTINRHENSLYYTL